MSNTTPRPASSTLGRMQASHSTPATENDFAKPTWWRDALDREDPNWEDPFELTKYCDVGNPSWWLPYDPGDPGRLEFPSLQDMIDTPKRPLQMAPLHSTEKKGGQRAVQLCGDQGRVEVSKPTTKPRRSARIMARGHAQAAMEKRDWEREVC
ncbi:hypothetical protein DL768_006570 [Monosporascus sp. mg162]|nr:hypothetical protein DL768_006570 [Monosporascus sp. mg162]